MWLQIARICVVLLTVLCSVKSENGNICPPEELCPVIPDGVAEPVLTLLPVPSDCKQFIKCFRGTPNYKACPDGLHFNDNLKVCDWPKNAQCTACNQVDPEPIECEEQPSCPIIDEDECEDNLTLLTVVGNCTQFIKCERGNPHYITCPSGLYFNQNLGLCDLAENVNCVPCTYPETTEAPEETDEPENICAPQPNCPIIPDGEEELELTLLPVVDDCTKFIKCDRGTPFLKNCPSGLHFNVELRVCDWPWAAGCEECIDGGDTTTGSPPGVTDPGDNGNSTDGNGGICGPQPTCPIIPDGEEELELTLLPVVDDCTKFIKCDRGTPFLKNCPSGLHFNVKLRVCDWPWAAGCEECIDGGDTTTGSPPGVTDPGDNGNSTDGNGGICGPQPTCPIIPDGEEEFELTLLPVVDDCTKFIKCDRGTPFLKNCPSGLHFNVKLRVCDWPWAAGCEECIDGGDTTTGSPPDVTDPGDNGNSTDGNGGICGPQPTCPIIPDGEEELELTLLPVVDDCTKFIKCDRGTPFLKNCPSGLHFNVKLRVCDWPWAAGCEECIDGGDTTTGSPPGVTDPGDNGNSTDGNGGICGPQPTCPIIPDGEEELELTLLPVVDDCTKFIKCDRGTPFLKNCPSGLHFNVKLRVCDWPWAAGCEECIDGGDTTTGSPPGVTDPGDNGNSTDGNGGICGPQPTCPIIPDGEEELELTLLPVVDDCTKFIKCDRGTPFLKNCPSGLHFNVKLRVCDWPWAAGCEECIDGGDTTTGSPPGVTDPGDNGNSTDGNGGICGPQPTCPIIPDGEEELELTLLPVVDDCTKFIKCERGTPFLKNCPSGLHFNVKLRVCDWPWAAGCEECIDGGDTTTGSPPGVTDPGDNGNSTDGNGGICGPQPTCPIIPDGEEEFELTLLPVVDDCTKFIKCDRGTPFLKNCPSGLHFNVKLRVCDWPWAAGCEECIDGGDTTTGSPPGVTDPGDNGNSTDGNGGICGPQPTCPIIPDGEEELELTLLPVVDDCTKFIKCERGTPFLKNCPSGLHFNVELRVCDWPKDAGCEECINGGETTTGSPPGVTDPGDNGNSTDGNGGICGPQPTCPIIPDGEEELELTLLPVVDDCTKFIKCDRGTPFLKNCPSGLHFNVKLRVCDWPWAAGCEECIDGGDTTTGSPPGVTDPGDNGNSTDGNGGICGPQPTCPIIPDGEEELELTLLPVVDDCTKFIKCDRGTPFLKNCPSGLHFNVKLRVCDWPWAAGCEECIDGGDTTTGSPPGVTDPGDNGNSTDGNGGICGPQPTCPIIPDGEEELELTLLPVVDDCTKFIKCDRGTPFLKNCPSGLHFNVKLRVCDWPWAAGCEECIDGGDTTTGSPPGVTDPGDNGNSTDGNGGICGPQPTCPIIPDGEEELELTLLPVVDDCTKFIKCERGTPFLKNCPSGLHFNVELRVCDWPKDAGCEECINGGETTTGSPPGVTDPGDNGNSTDGNGGICGSQPTCPIIPDGEEELELTLLPVVDDCTKFIKCDRGTPFLKNCPSGLHFNVELRVCDWPEDAGCEECMDSGETTTVDPGNICGAQPSCPEIPDDIAEPELTLLPVIDDCTKFIKCERGYPHFKNCPSGLHFNTELNVCDWPEDAGCTACITS